MVEVGRRRRISLRCAALSASGQIGQEIKINDLCGCFLSSKLFFIYIFSKDNFCYIEAFIHPLSFIVWRLLIT